MRSFDYEKTQKTIKTQFTRSADKYIASKVHSNIEDLRFICNFIQPERAIEEMVRLQKKGERFSFRTL